MIKVTYLIPLDSLGGGVEVAAKQVKNLSNKLFNFDVEYVLKDKSELFKISAILKSLLKVYSMKPNVLIVSLWRAQLVGVFVKFLLPRTKIIFFVHSAKDAHFLDYWLSRLTLIVATEVWGDSITSLKDRFRHSYHKVRVGRVISFSARNISKLKEKNVEPNFIYWGRIGKEKGVDRALIIFAKILKFYPNAEFHIIGSDGGALDEVKELCQDLEVAKSVTFNDEMDFSKIEFYASKACFYLQTSVYEGAAMSVMESMKLGLVPIVTPVGEISRYCNSSNSVVVRSNYEVVRDIVLLLESNEQYKELSNNASLIFKGQLSYVDSINSSTELMVKKWF